MSTLPLIRHATKADAPALLALYRPYVENTTISFELEAPSVEEFVDRIAKTVSGWAWLVAEQQGRCIGYAYASAHRERAAYRWSVETSAYVHPEHRRCGIARTLYSHLFEELKHKGYCNAFAGVALPNDASLAMHRSVGFEFIGVFKSVGRKFGAWQDVAWLQRALRDAPLSE